jgi:hypothetical protein
MSRRKLLAGVGFGVAAVGALATPALQLSWTRKPGAKASWWDRQFGSLDRAGLDEWSRQVGASFTLAGGAARLAEVIPMASSGRRPSGLRDRAFKLVFESAGAALPGGDQMLDVVHAGGASLKIFFSASPDTLRGNRLQAIFN